jgi:hypothetical protein
MISTHECETAESCLILNQMTLFEGITKYSYILCTKKNNDLKSIQW